MTDLGSILITGAIIFTGTVVTCIGVFMAVRHFVSSEFRRHGYEPVDHEANQAEMDEVFKPIRN